CVRGEGDGLNSW
nr:immunoglobulin heavy chain junction region [Macaca mulatta]MOW20202.1 immunoglobulin heavy chain junction region [Macaca mulatta]MOW21503.1 immunoglobulin heavy chain junction region [Macaca mulatta]